MACPGQLAFSSPLGLSGAGGGVHYGAADSIVEENWPHPRFSLRLLPKGIPKGLVVNGLSSTIGSPK